jgi:Ion channel
MTVRQGRRARELVEAYRSRRFAWLFVTLLLALAAAPLVEAALPGIPALELLLGLSLLAAIGSAEPKSWLRWLLMLGATFLAARLVQSLTGSERLLSLSQLLWLLAAVMATITTVRYAFRPGVVDGERIFAALDTYLMVGLIFAVSYWLIDQTWPASFGAPSEPSLPLRESVYFSFVTIATLGYGDIVPVSDFVRSLAVVEAVSGQLYLAVLVARLVSLYAKQAD